MSDEGFDDWDADFVFQLIQVEEQALSLSNPTQLHHPQPPPPSSHFPPPPAPPPYDNISYSPPRERMISISLLLPLVASSSLRFRLVTRKKKKSRD
ncbi:hypothetical protein CsSME_00044440 [Camellia sinensis var. sinensis]